MLFRNDRFWIDIRFCLSGMSDNIRSFLIFTLSEIMSQVHFQKFQKLFVYQTFDSLWHCNISFYHVINVTWNWYHVFIFSYSMFLVYFWPELDFLFFENVFHLIIMLFLLSQLTFFLTIEHKTKIKYIYTLGNIPSEKSQQSKIEKLENSMDGPFQAVGDLWTACEFRTSWFLSGGRAVGLWSF